MKKTEDVRLKVLFDGSCSREAAEKAMSMIFIPKQGVILMAETEKTKKAWFRPNRARK